MTWPDVSDPSGREPLDPSSGTLVLEPPEAPPASARRGSRLAGLAHRSPWLVLVLMALAALARFPHVATAYDINGDEVDYTDLALSIRHGVFPPQFQHSTFLLHPPLYFSFGAAWTSLFQVHGSYFNELTAMRTLNAVFAVVSTGLLYALGTRLAGRWAGTGAALLFAVDPYILRQNERAMIETSTAVFLLAGWLVVARMVDTNPRRPWAWAAGGGLLLGLSVVDKDIASILVVVPLLAVLAFRIGMSRKVAGIALGASILPYAVYVIILSVDGFFSAFLSQETIGLRRELGLIKVTGFNRAGSPSLLNTALHQFSQFGVTYVLSGLGALASIYLLFRAERPALRIWAAVSLCGVASLAYSLFFGTIEEQMLYFMYVPALISLMAGVMIAIRKARASRAVNGRRLVAAALALFVLYDTAVWFQVRATPSNGLARVVSWFKAQPTPPGTIANDTSVTTMLLTRSGLSAIDVTTPQAAAGARVRYLTILSDSVKGNYGSLDPAQAGFFEHYGRLVFQYHESTYGRVSIYQTTNPAIW
jgi:4-amino-4-deoxy-L-arabinose transferase-like glycosyltransferase